MPDLKYINSLGARVVFKWPEFYVDHYDLRNFMWNYNSEYEKITSFNHDGIETKELPLYIFGKTKNEAYALRNSLFEIFETDVLAKNPGKFYIGDYYFQGYVVGSKKEEYLVSKRLLKLELTVVSDLNIWIKDSFFAFYRPDEVWGHGYPYNYPYRYAYGAFRTLTNESLSASDFKMRIYGEVSNPTVYIGNHPYKVNVTVKNGEHLEIDSMNKFVEIVHVDGSRTSIFAFRDRDNYIFEKIPAGVQPVSWNRLFGFDLTIFARRSEPTWT